MKAFTPSKADHHRIFFERETEGVAFVAALSRFLSSPDGALYLAPANAIEVRSHELPGGQLELYLSSSALDAAVGAFSPIPASEAVSSDALPEACVLLIQGAVSPWGIDDAQIHLTPMKSING